MTPFGILTLNCKRFWTGEREEEVISFFSETRTEKEINDFYFRLVVAGYKGKKDSLIQKAQNLINQQNGIVRKTNGNPKRLGHIRVSKRSPVTSKKQLIN